VQSSLDVVVTRVATRLMGVDAASSVKVSRQVMADLVSHFDVDIGFLRHHDHRIHASRLIAKWPPRADAGDVDPLELIYFAEADPMFAFAEHLTEPTVFRAEAEDYQRATQDRRQVPTSSVVCAPLLSGDVTTGVLGFVKHGAREWSVAELNALMAITSLFAQVRKTSCAIWPSTTI